MTCPSMTHNPANRGRLFHSRPSLLKPLGRNDRQTDILTDKLITLPPAAHAHGVTITALMILIRCIQTTTVTQIRCQYVLLEVLQFTSETSSYTFQQEKDHFTV